MLEYLLEWGGSMNFELPNFGKKNIKCIDFNSDNHNIIVYRYGMKKGEEIIQKIPKKRNNEQDLNTRSRHTRCGNYHHQCNIKPHQRYQ